jgi:hypothetical protein
VNREHFLAFVWLRYRLRMNQLRRGGAANAIVLGVVAVALAVTAIGAGVDGFLVGLLALGDASPTVVLFAWDAAVGLFLFVWMIALMADLQKSEAVSLEKVLHLPVSPAGAFAVNYLSSLFSLSLVAFLPGFVGFALGLAGSRGPLLLIVLPLLAAFLFAVTALTYQFQGWLAALMSNPRRRRTIVVVMTLGFILVAQTPQALNIARMSGQSDDGTARNAALAAAGEERNAALAAAGEEQNAALKSAGEDQGAVTFAATAALRAGELSSDQYRVRLDQNQRDYQARLDRLGQDYKTRLQRLGVESQARGEQAERDRQAVIAEQSKIERDRLESVAWIVNTVLPPGWLPLGTACLADGNPIPSLLGTLGLTVIGAGGLWRAYRTTVRMSTGRDTGGAGRPTIGSKPAGPRRLSMVEWRLPGVSEPAAGVAAAGLRSLLRAPEVKMVLLAPALFLIVFGSIAATMSVSPTAYLRPVIAAGGAGMVLFAATALVCNQFGYDRAGFRAYVLAPVSRRDILLGKNLAAAPLALGIAWATVFAVGVVYPMRFDHLLATLCQAATMYLILCGLGNAASVLVPLPIAAGAVQASGVRFTQVLGQMLIGSLLPVAALPTFLPLGIEVALAEGIGWGGLPVAFVLSIPVFVAVAALYRQVLTWEGRLLAAREQEVLRVVTSKEE